MASTLPLTAGSSHAPPPATTRTARCRSSAGTPFRVKPDAPARRTPASTSSSSNVVSASTGGLPSRRRSSRVACTPSITGIRTSISTTSGASDSTAPVDLAAVRTFANDVEAELGAQDATQAGAHQLLIVHQQHPDHDAFSRRRLRSSGNAASTSQPRPPGPAVHVPPRDCSSLAHVQHTEARSLSGRP